MSRAVRSLCPGLATGLALLLLPPAAAHAWGPHPAITRAAYAVLPADDRLDARLGGSRRLEETCWLADYQGDAFSSWYPDDFLLFPAVPRQIGHVLPEARAAWTPYFRRALQALRSESPENAARWVGSLLHFQQDSGSPPHAHPTGGEMHTQLENWVDAAAIRLGEYRPRLLGETDERALATFLERMEGLVAFSAAVCARARPLAEAGQRERVEPAVLESALETARVSADLLHTLLVLSRGESRGAALVVRIRGPRHPTMPGTPARLLLLGSDYSTLAEEQRGGEAEYRAEAALRNLNPGDYRAVVYRTGFRPLSLGRLPLKSGRAKRVEVRLAPDRTSGNLVRDPTHEVCYTTPGQPEHWRRGGAGDGAAWESAAIPVLEGMRYDVVFRLRGEPSGGSTRVETRWDRYVDFGPALRTDAVERAKDGTCRARLVAPPQARLLRLRILTVGPIRILEHAAATLDADYPPTLGLRYLRQAGRGTALEAEFGQRPQVDRLLQTSVTHRPGTEMRVEVERGLDGALRSAALAQRASGRESRARIDWKDGRARITREGREDQFLQCPADSIVTTAPDWTDILLIARRYDRERGGKQEFPGLWAHPTQPAQRLTFTAERTGSGRAPWGFLWLPLERLEITLRGGGRYEVWVMEDGKVLRLAPGGGGPAIFLEGYEQAAQGIEADEDGAATRLPSGPN